MSRETGNRANIPDLTVNPIESVTRERPRPGSPSSRSGLAEAVAVLDGRLEAVAQKQLPYADFPRRPVEQRDGSAPKQGGRVPASARGAARGRRQRTRRTVTFATGFRQSHTPALRSPTP